MRGFVRNHVADCVIVGNLFPSDKVQVRMVDIALHARSSEQQHADVLRRRIAWFDSQLDLNPENLIFIDETAASTKMARLPRRAPCGERCRAAAP